MAELLIELFSEEIPARMQLGAARDFERLMAAKLTASGLTAESLKAYVGPRRLALVAEGLPSETAAVSEEVKGPKEGAPEQAMAGFLRKVGLTQDRLVLENGVWLARIEKPGVKTADVLGDMLREVILAFPWPKSMRSGTSTFRWVRPLKRILFLFDGAVVPFELEGLTASNVTEGHRFLGSGQPLVVNDFASYQKALADNSVILDHAERQAIILEQAKAVCAEAGCELIEDQGLLEEVAGLNEYPVPLLGDMDPQFLTLPPEVIKTSMRTHQKYFAVGRVSNTRDLPGFSDAPQATDIQYLEGDGSSLKIQPKFVITSNMRAVDGGVEIKRGNAKVLSARLSDGVFFWKEDNREGNFDQWLKKLEGVTFHAKLGTLAQRVLRIVELAKAIAPFVQADPVEAAEAARLAKADLASYMVGEFPELQGVMGGYYADKAGKTPNIGHAIRQHYKPQGPGDYVPSTPLAATIALADKIDTLIGFFAIDEKPTGSKDPFALRRSALGILRIIREHGARLSFGPIFSTWYAAILEIYPWTGADISIERNSSPIEMEARAGGNPPRPNPKYQFRSLEDVRTDVLDFFNDRLKVMLKDEGVPFDVLDAVFAVADDDIVRLVARANALQTVLTTPQGEDLLALHKRAANILAAEAKKEALPEGSPRHLPDAPEVETALITQLAAQKETVAAQVLQENYAEALHTIAAMRHNVDGFLDGVLVNADDKAIKANRLLILKGITDLSAGMSDLSKIA